MTDKNEKLGLKVLPGDFLLFTDLFWGSSLI